MIASKFAASYALQAWAGADVVGCGGRNLGVARALVLALALALALALSLALPAPLRPMARLGRWSLSYYMLHQPVLLGLLAAVAWFARP